MPGKMLCKWEFSPFVQLGKLHFLNLFYILYFYLGFLFYRRVLWLKTKYETIGWDRIGALRMINSTPGLRFQTKFKIYKNWGQADGMKGLHSDNNHKKTVAGEQETYLHLILA